MKIIVGLGNPGMEYTSTKHNIGFEVVKALAKKNGIKINKRLHFSLYGKGAISGVEVMLVLPQAFMNLSGRAVGELLDGRIKDLQDLLVVCDDINIELGRIRMRKGGSSGGQKGLESIITTARTSDFVRLRIGIATDIHKGDITGYVLAPFKRKDKRNVAHVVTLAGEAVTCMIEEGVDKAMSKFNKRKIGTS